MDGRWAIIWTNDDPVHWRIYVTQGVNEWIYVMTPFMQYIWISEIGCSLKIIDRLYYIHYVYIKQSDYNFYS